jgi:hypothetical protein
MKDWAPLQMKVTRTEWDGADSGWLTNRLSQGKQDAVTRVINEMIVIITVNNEAVCKTRRAFTVHNADVR